MIIAQVVFCHLQSSSNFIFIFTRKISKTFHNFLSRKKIELFNVKFNAALELVGSIINWNKLFIKSEFKGMQFAIKALGMFGSGLGGAELSKTYKVLQKNVRKVDVEHFMAQFLVLKFCTKITIPT